jgi:beta-phosphoglucomutase-like phosphatase (HAD superfamily)
LKILGLTDRFNIILTSNDVVNFKPDPEIYLKVAKYLKVSPASCLVIEDSLVGCQASLGAGMKTYAFVHNKKMKKNFKNIQLDGFLETTSDIYRAIGESERI